MDFPLISVIVPVYNVEPYLAQCLESIVAQTYPNLEAVLVDDGSTDNCGKICDFYAEKYLHFKVIHKANAGQGIARNTGLEHISGKYVTFVDSDDWIEPDMILHLYQSLVENNADVCRCGMKYISSSGEVLSVVQYDNKNYPGSQGAKDCLLRLLGSPPERHDSIEPSAWGALFSTDVIYRFHLRFPSERKIVFEDFWFNIDYLLHADGACVTDQTEYLYRMRAESTVHIYRADRLEACVNFRNELTDKLLTCGYDTSAVFRLDRQFFVHLRGIIRQETPRNSGLTKRENLQNIRNVCENETVQSAIRNYPVKRMGWKQFKQRAFLYLICEKHYRVLYYLSTLGLI